MDPGPPGRGHATENVVQTTSIGEEHRVPALAPFAFDGGADVVLTDLPRRTSVVNLMVYRDSPAAGRREGKEADPKEIFLFRVRKSYIVISQ